MGRFDWRVDPDRLWRGADALQPAHFERVYAAYGGVFIILSILWGWLVDGVKPDASDIIGMLFCMVGVGFIMYTPRGR